MSVRIVRIALASYRRADEAETYAMLGETVDVHPDDLERFDRLNGAAIVEAEPEADPDLPDEADDLPEDLQALNLAELREIAKEQGVDLGGATRKADIIAALSA